MSKVSHLHKASAPKSVGLYIITCSSSKAKELSEGQQPSDESGDTIERLALKAGHNIHGRKLISDSKTTIAKITKQALRMSKVDGVIITGGSGLSPRDVTIESLKPIVEKEIPGFGELFRKISFDSIGPAALLSRAFAGVRKGKAIFCLPGSPDAVQTAMDRLILPELGHIIKISRQR